jgi:hypothetical protein
MFDAAVQEVTQGILRIASWPQGSEEPFKSYRTALCLMTFPPFALLVDNTLYDANLTEEHPFLRILHWTVLSLPSMALFEGTAFVDNKLFMEKVCLVDSEVTCKKFLVGSRNVAAEAVVELRRIRGVLIHRAEAVHILIMPPTTFCVRPPAGLRIVLEANWTQESELDLRQWDVVDVDECSDERFVHSNDNSVAGGGWMRAISAALFGVVGWTNGSTVVVSFIELCRNVEEEEIANRTLIWNECKEQFEELNLLRRETECRRASIQISLAWECGQIQKKHVHPVKGEEVRRQCGESCNKEARSPALIREQFLQAARDRARKQQAQRDKLAMSSHRRIEALGEVMQMKGSGRETDYDRVMNSFERPREQQRSLPQMPASRPA